MEHDSADDSGEQGREQAARAAEDDDLAESMAALSRLSSGRWDLVDLLAEVASFAVQAIPGAEGAGLTLLEPDRADTIVKSAPFVEEIDDIQYGLGEGPCISAAETGRTMRSGSLGDDPRWPRFGPEADRLGVHSVLSLPLIAGDVVVGAMNVYAHAPDSFDERSEELGELFAVPAAIAVQNAQILAQTRRLAVEPSGGVDQPGGDRSGHRHHAEPQRDLRGRGLRPAPSAQSARAHQGQRGRGGHCAGSDTPGPGAPPPGYRLTGTPNPRPGGCRWG